MTQRIAELIPLDPDFLRGTSAADVARRLQRILRSTRFEVVPDASAFRILGPDTPYHAHDPFLPAGLRYLSAGLRIEHAQSFRTSRSAFDLCLEDSWSGYFVAEWLRASPTDEDIVFIHLDHHTDMMSSLLERNGDRLLDPTGGCVFDPSCSGDWQTAITAGSVGIGSFVTTLFRLPNRIHVRHLNNFRNSDYATYRVAHAARRYSEIPDRSYACIRKRRDQPSDAAGTYRGGCDPLKLLEGLPAGRVVVHIDLDYFINDFNGNPPDRAWALATDAREAARQKLEAFILGMATFGIHVDRWIVATSPGFCSAYHWPWLLDRIECGVQRVNG